MKKQKQNKPKQCFSQLMEILGKVSAQLHPTLCIQFLDRENNDKNNKLPLEKQICFTMVWGCAEILPNIVFTKLSDSHYVVLSGKFINKESFSIYFYFRIFFIFLRLRKIRVNGPLQTDTGSLPFHKECK